MGINDRIVAALLWSLFFVVRFRMSSVFISNIYFFYSLKEKSIELFSKYLDLNENAHGKSKYSGFFSSSKYVLCFYMWYLKSKVCNKSVQSMSFGFTQCFMFVCLNNVGPYNGFVVCLKLVSHGLKVWIKKFLLEKPLLLLVVYMYEKNLT